MAPPIRSIAMPPPRPNIVIALLAHKYAGWITGPVAFAVFTAIGTQLQSSTHHINWSGVIGAGILGLVPASSRSVSPAVHEASIMASYKGD